METIQKIIADLADMVARTWEFIQRFVDFVFTTVANSLFGGWTTVFALGGVALVLFLVTRTFRRGRG
jgi:hypothetical protein